MMSNGVCKLSCARIQLSNDNNAQEIFERINSTGVPLSLADKIRNFVLMTDEDQDRLFEDYWLVIETNRLFQTVLAKLLQASVIQVPLQYLDPCY
jgi:uncharacterized protein with ParB-like and HNH nuclease domain